MKLFSGNGLILCTALLLTGVASASKMGVNTGSSASNQSVQRVSYTASGTTDMKTARMFKKLLKNSRHLQVRAEVNRVANKAIYTPRKANVDVSVNYTVTGKTSIKTVQRLIKLFQNSKQVQVTARANIKANSARVSQRSGFSRQENRYNRYNNTFAGYQPVNYYYGYPPLQAQNVN